jgi:hypothetical protein
MTNGRYGSNYQSNAVDSAAESLPRRAAARTSFRSSWWSWVALALIVGITCGLLKMRSAAAQSVPTGTIELSGGSVAAGIGYTWGHGTLIFEGKKYRLKMQGLSIVQVGVSSYTASGTVYDLTKLSDINGIYTAVAAGAAIAGGASATAMKNSHGVLIQLVSNHMGLNFSLSAKGVDIKLE